MKTVVRCASIASRVVEHGSGPQVCLAHPERLLDMPRVVVGADDFPPRS